MKNDILVTLGVHSHSYRVMANLNLDDSEFETSHGLKLIKNNIKFKTHYYSSPEGLQNNFNNEVIKVLKKNGIKIYPTAI